MGIEGGLDGFRWVEGFVWRLYCTTVDNWMSLVHDRSAGKETAAVGT